MTALRRAFYKVNSGKPRRPETVRYHVVVIVSSDVVPFHLIVLYLECSDGVLECLGLETGDCLC